MEGRPVETKRKQSQFYRYIQVWIFVLLTSLTASAQSFLQSGYRPLAGNNFFILTDATFSSQDVSKIRFEINSSNGDIDKVDEYGGVDIAIYEVSQPINFLKSQKNLHRVNTKYDYRPSGEVANAVSYVWDHFYKKSRLLWQTFLSQEVRTKAVKVNAGFKQEGPDSYRTQFTNYKQFKPMKGFKIIEEFRYPLTKAKPITPPDVKLSGSSHNFNEPNRGNVYIPIGKLKPGLYLVEAMLGDHRANTLVFVSDSVLVSKISGNEIFVWAADKAKGSPVEGMKILITDGIGTLHEGETNDEGVKIFKGKGPEQSYFVGTDEKGGVLISENFYHDSEIYFQKIYAFTDRPLYRPGDQVRLKVIARKFSDSSKSEWIKGALFEMLVIDSSGTILLKEGIKIDGDKGGETSFRLPSFTLPGGYTVLLKNKNDSYASEFRVARYAKPHFNLDVLVNPVKPQLNSPISALIQMSYANGKPVKDGTVNVVVRKQKLTVIEGDTDMQSLFPVEVSDTVVATDDDGKVSIDLPKVNEPSKYILYVKGSDVSDLTVNATSEIVVESANDPYVIESVSAFSAKGVAVDFLLRKVTTTNTRDPELTWEALRLEDRSSTKGDVDGKNFSIKFPEAGSYQVKVYSKNGDLLGARSHIVAGEKLRTLDGFITLAADKESYAPGDKARVLVSFSEDVSEALITLERDKVERFSLSGNGKWAKVSKSSPREWIVEVPVDTSMAPNVTLSVLYVKNGKLVFNNKGLQIKRPEIDLAFKLDKKSYVPGELVKLELTATMDNKPIETHVSLSVVDEMIYVLQPEISPSILDFFYHARRNQVKTSSSLSFFTYDSAISASGKKSASSSYSDRPLKLKERPRREEVDTAFWGPSLKTDANGKLSLQFRVPDSVTRWRVTARGIASSGVVGQKVMHFNSEKDVYLKWGGLSELRKNDVIETSVIGFNHTNSSINGKLVTKTGEVVSKQDVNLTIGVNYLPVKFKAESTQDLKLSFEGVKKDALDKLITVRPATWETTKELNVDLKNGANKISVPKNSFHYQLVSQMDLSDQFFKVAKDLIEYPHGCVEQTSSRLIPLTFAYAFLKNPQLKDQIISAREHLINMANRDGLFGWYDEMANESFLTVYAYLADYYASRELGITLPPSHFAKMQKAYRDLPTENLLKNSMMIWMIAHTGQPVQSLLSGVWAKLKLDKTGKASEGLEGQNLTMNQYQYSDQHQLAVLFLSLANLESQKHKLTVTKEVASEIDEEVKRMTPQLETSKSLLLRAASLRLKMVGLQKDQIKVTAEKLFFEMVPESSTADRALSLILLQDVLKTLRSDEKFEIGGSWKKISSPLGLKVWEYSGKPSDALSVDLSGLKAPKGQFKLIYGTFDLDKHELPLAITHKYYELTKTKEMQYSATPHNGRDFQVDKFYLSEVVIKGQGAYAYSVTEVPLVPGSIVEKGFEDVDVTMPGAKGKQTFSLSNAPEMKELYYSIPVRYFKNETSYQHVIRFGAKGTFNVPQARFYEMYRGYRKGYAGKNSPALQVVNVK
jgi:uncharacterized protein YfaS (alpha-2-macroglobulin family)